MGTLRDPCPICTSSSRSMEDLKMVVGGASFGEETLAMAGLPDPQDPQVGAPISLDQTPQRHWSEQGPIGRRKGCVDFLIGAS